MLELTCNGQPVQLAPGTTVQLELNSPLFDEEVITGDYSFSFAVPAAPNGEAYGFPELPEAAAVGGQLPAGLSDDGYPLLSGTQRVRSASAAKYTVNLQGGLSGLAAALGGKKLAAFAYGGERRVRPFVASTDEWGEPVFVPGLVALANATVADPHGYDFVFAPLSNDGALNPEQPQAGHFVNAWTWLTQPRFGLPTGGTFAYSPLAPPLLCPFPWLRYVLASIFTELGLRVDAGHFLPGELGELLVGSTAALPALTTRFRLADVLPDLTVVEVLARLRRDLGVVVLVSPEQLVRTAQLGQAPASDYVDLTHLCTGLPELERPEPVGATLTYSVDDGDELTKDLVQPFGLLPEGAPVARLVDLPATVALQGDQLTGYTNVPAPELRLVQESSSWYRSALNHIRYDTNTAHLAWTFYAYDYRPLDVAGGGDERPTGTAVTLMLPGTCTALGQAVAGLYPTVRQQAYRPDAPDQAPRSTALRLWYWRGLQPSTTDPTVQYPLVSPHNRNAQGLREQSLRLDGPDGTYQRWQRAWLPRQLAPVVGKTQLQLTPEQLAAHDPARRVRLAGVDYLVRKLAPTLPLTRPVPVELVVAD
jgi:hypothetical protein